ncbi:hypothetical protein FB45DRAFT_1025825 [Roridomyces roridus]|uniref:Mitochondrial ribosomal protein L27 n=1 Tax=Roridomyces roridus TaxID=1738132 RepID=A0AAD7BZF5_9AGAR|nr:hypothetical protein FB45DRAFT_1025825 [Roridomyces roridus]
MHPTATLAAHIRYQARRALQSFRANKDFYKGNRQAALPGHRTGAPGVHVRGRPGYRLLESRVRVFVAPPIDDILNSKLKPYVSPRVRLPHNVANGVFRGMPDSGLTPAHLLATTRRLSEEKALEQRDAVSAANSASPTTDSSEAQSPS